MKGKNGDSHYLVHPSLQSGRTSEERSPKAVILSLRRIPRGDRDGRFSRRVIGTDGGSCGAVSFESAEGAHNAGWYSVRSFASSG